MLGVVAIVILLVILVMIVLELWRIICIRNAKKHFQNADLSEKTAEIERWIFLLLKLWGIEARLGWETEKTDQILADKFASIEAGDYMRVCSIMEKAVYGGCELEAYEMRTLYYFIEKIAEENAAADWKMRIKLHYAYLIRN